MTAGTSATDPLRIAEVPAGAGMLGVSLCPGKQQRGARSGEWRRDLGADLDAVKAWGATLVVSALERNELRALAVEGLPEEVEGRGIEWHHLPIPDFGVPGVAAEARWFWAGTRIHRVLCEGGRVFVHCKGGLGRSGLVAGRVLIERGEAVPEAIARVRAARPGAIENAAQELFLEGIRGLTGLPEPKEAPTFAERVLGCLLGGAVGDGFGYAVEFSTLAQIRARFGAAGLRVPVYEQGRLVVSDDTQMTLFTAEGMIRQLQPGANAGAEPGGVWRAYQRWLETQGGLPVVAFGARGWLMDEAAMRHQRAPGNTCLGALRAGVMGTPERPVNDSKGCGTVMRTAPTGLSSESSIRVAYRRGVRYAALTHGHATGQAAAGILSSLLHNLRKRLDIESAARRACIAAATCGPVDAATHAAVLAAIAAASEHGRERPAGGLGEGWVAEEALAIGLWGALAGRDFADTLALGANHDGDSDSTASIAGQIRGTHEGAQAIPAQWARRLDVLEPLLVIAHDLVELAEQGRSPRFLRPYPLD